MVRTSSCVKCTFPSIVSTGPGVAMNEADSWVTFAPLSMPLLNVPAAEAVAVWLPVLGPGPPPASVHEAHPSVTTATAPVTSAGKK